MKRVYIIIALAMLCSFLIPLVAQAQTCPNPITISCNESVSGDNTSGSENIVDYSCHYSSMDGPEVYYLLTLQTGWHVQVDIDAQFDSGIYILNQLTGDCDPDDCLIGDDDIASGESIESDLPAGTYYIVVDGYGTDDYGTYDLSVACDSCVDADNDGFLVQETGCAMGDDCNDADNTVYPGAPEVCEDGIDQDCDGDDPLCPYCSSLGPIDCDTEILANNGQAGSSDLVDSYDCLPYSETSTEVAWTFSPDFSGSVRIRLSSQNDDLALAIIPADGPCAGHLCLAGADRIFGPGEEVLLVDVEAGQEYFIVVDGWSNSQDDFSLVIDCAGCTDADGDGFGDYLCGGTDCADDDGAINPDAQEDCDELDNDCDGETDEDFDLMVDPEHCGVCTTACVDPQVCDQGNCADDCSGGLTACLGGCYDTQTDLEHCGTCAEACDVPNAENQCVTGTCGVAGCLSGFGDCNGDGPDGCEEDLLTSVVHCGQCNNPCTPFDNSQAACAMGICALGECDPGYANCNGQIADGCETPTDSNTAHCGECGNGCAQHEFCVAGACTNQCPDGLDNCGGVCMDTSADPINCGGCGRVCQFDNAESPECSEGSCVLGACVVGFGNCNTFPEDGCEQSLGSTEHCLACDDACTYSHAKGRCVENGCEMDVCDHGWTDCNDSLSDGCEINTGGDGDNCGICGHECQRLEACVGGTCVVGCEDSDEDGFAEAECGGTDCDDDDALSYPGAEELCDGKDNDCDGVADDGFDGDGDGFLDGSRCEGEGLDCDDSQAGVNPDATEICGDSIDQDCDGQDEECICPDADRDGALDAACGGEDCNDQNYAVHPHAQESCNDVDDDCDGLTDEDGACSSGKESCDCSAQGNPGGGFFWLLVVGLLALRARRQRA